MKGQFNIEYMISLIVFISIVVYLAFQVSNILPEFHVKSFEDKLSSKTFGISELLIKDSGWWSDGTNDGADWENNPIDDTKRFGFATEPYVLSLTKLEEFNNTCTNDYENTKDVLNLDEKRDFQVKVYVDGVPKVECGMIHIPVDISEINVHRYAVTNDAGQIKPTQMILKVW